jgi:hypothetical protein
MMEKEREMGGRRSVESGMCAGEGKAGVREEIYIGGDRRWRETDWRWLGDQGDDRNEGGETACQ